MLLVARPRYVYRRLSWIAVAVIAAGVVVIPAGASWVGAVLGLGGFILAWSWLRRDQYALRTDAQGLHVCGPYVSRSIPWARIGRLAPEDGGVRIITPEGPAARIRADYGTTPAELAALIEQHRPAGVRR